VIATRAHTAPPVGGGLLVVSQHVWSGSDALGRRRRRIPVPAGAADLPQATAFLTPSREPPAPARRLAGGVRAAA